MGNIQSFSKHSCGYSILQRCPKSRCSFCGSVFDISTKKRFLNHFPAELYGISLKALQNDISLVNHSTNYQWEHKICQPKSSLDIKSENHFGIIDTPSISLPQRSCGVPKQYNNIYSLLKNSGSLFSKSEENSTLKHVYSTTLDVDQCNMASNNCIIYGCLFVEHGNLVFQAVSNRSRFSSYINNGFNSGVHAPTNVDSPLIIHTNKSNRSVTLSSDEKNDFRKHCLFKTSYQSLGTTTCQLRSHSQLAMPNTYTGFDQTRIHNISYDDRLPTNKLEAPMEFFKKSQRVPDYFLTKRTLGDELNPSSQLQSEQQFQGYNLNIFDLMTTKPGAPPPPLRLSLPLVTLRRFGFYRNRLFKIETGRKAPCGEGYYIFRIKRPREFRQFFEACIHQQKTFSSSYLHSKCQISDHNRMTRLLSYFGKLFQQTPATSVNNDDHNSNNNNNNNNNNNSCTSNSHSKLSAKFKIPQVVVLNKTCPQSFFPSSPPPPSSSSLTLVPKYSPFTLSHCFQFENAASLDTHKMFLNFNNSCSNLSGLIMGWKGLHALRPRQNKRKTNINVVVVDGLGMGEGRLEDEDEILNLPVPPKPPIYSHYHNYSNLMYDNLFEYYTGGGFGCGYDRDSGMVSNSFHELCSTSHPAIPSGPKQIVKLLNNCQFAISRPNRDGCGGQDIMSRFGRSLTKSCSSLLFFSNFGNGTNTQFIRQRHNSLPNLFADDDSDLAKENLKLTSKCLIRRHLSCTNEEMLDILTDSSPYYNLFASDVFSEVNQEPKILRHSQTTGCDSNSNLFNVYNSKAFTSDVPTLSDPPSVSCHYLDKTQIQCSAPITHILNLNVSFEDTCDASATSFKGGHMMKDFFSCHKIYLHHQNDDVHFVSNPNDGVTSGTSILHYASLDFAAPTPIRSHTQSDNGFPFQYCMLDSYLTNSSGGSNEQNTTKQFCVRKLVQHFGNSRDCLGNETWSQRYINDTEHVVVGDAGNVVIDYSNDYEGEDDGDDDSESDLPSNYVAICQLQTLAMRAVLSETT